MKRILILTAAGVMLSNPTELRAQSSTIDQDIERIDLNLLDLQFDFTQLDPAFIEEAPQRWKLTVGAPIAFNSNVANAETGALSDFHSAPSLALSYTRPMGGGVALEISALSTLDAYFDETAADQSSLGSSAKISLGDATKGWAPYASYSFTSLYSDQFGDHKVSTHSFTGGFGRTVGLAVGTKLSVDANVTRREASLATVEQWRFTASTTLSQQIDATSSFQVQAQAFWAGFTGGASDGRDDEQIILVGAYSRALVPDLVNLTIAAKFQRNWSNVAGKSYSVFDVGPRLNFVSKF
ncbi:hypothetical protein M3P36_04460 [Altererythrobacter sp. KTW20L]|uniref:hypothetical protein n=1 Tax=Altererythrobacter sp. KTW20L TaxID=2942210 RepID=UPI0020C150C4|nr:hypothetical protein [Altererythrobacter sp. KTW20L]MCL6250302.1 hypothetical protein [Altererythrobacter sp. KTW20L]